MHLYVHDTAPLVLILKYRPLKRFKTKALRSFETSGSTNPEKQRYVTQDPKRQQNRSGKLELANGSISDHPIFA